VTSAIVISPPVEVWKAIQNIRIKYDKAYERWMPHINLLYPFVPENEFIFASKTVQNAISGLEPFSIRFTEMGYFIHGSNATLYLKPIDKPNNSLVKLQSILQNSFPYCNELSTKSSNGFQPHLTLGQFAANNIQNTIEEFQRSWEPIEFSVNQIYIISRTNSTPFQIKYTLHLGVSSTSVPVEQHVQSLEEVVQKIQSWILSQKIENNKSLPKNREKFRNAIQRMCDVNCSLNVDFIVENLKKNDNIQLEMVDGIEQVKYLDVKSTGKLIVPLGQEENEVNLIYQKVLNWLKTEKKAKLCH